MRDTFIIARNSVFQSSPYGFVFYCGSSDSGMVKWNKNIEEAIEYDTYEEATKNLPKTIRIQPFVDLHPRCRYA